MWGSCSCRCGPGIHIASFYQQDCQVCAAPRGAPTPVSTICDHHNSGTTSTGGLGCTRGQDVTMTHQQMHATSLYTQQPMQKSHSATPLHHQHPHTKPRTCNHIMHGQTRVLDTSRSECPCKAFRALCASHARECTTKPQTHPNNMPPQQPLRLHAHSFPVLLCAVTRDACPQTTCSNSSSAQPPVKCTHDAYNAE